MTHSGSNKYQKQLIFDLDTVLLRNLFGDSYTGVYYDIRTFLEKHGFDHIEGSSYISQKPLTDVQLARVIISLKQTFPFLNKCVKNMHSANVMDRHSWNDRFDYDGTLDGLEIS